VAVVNAGSSSLKLAVLALSEHGPQTLVSRDLPWRAADPDTLAEALESLDGAPDAFGHRVVHGGRRLVRPTTVTADVERTLQQLEPLAPLHNAPALAAIRAVRARFGGVPSVAVFDTAFHADRPAVSTRYALPAELVARHGLRRYGFHGIAHASLLEQLCRLEGLPAGQVNAVTLQLGAGCSACAIRRGRSLETSMGFTPLEGLVMATRSGDVDPAVVLRLARAGHHPDELETLLTRRSGLYALCGRTDMREILTAAQGGDEAAELAVALFCHRVVLTVGAYLTLLQGEGALVFGGGIGTHSPTLRERIVRGLGAWGVELDPVRNHDGGRGRISATGSRPVYALATDEASVIARAVAHHLGWAAGG
jgi:acetate kinase